MHINFSMEHSFETSSVGLYIQDSRGAVHADDAVTGLLGFGTLQCIAFLRRPSNPLAHDYQPSLQRKT